MPTLQKDGWSTFRQRVDSIQAAISARAVPFVERPAPTGSDRHSPAVNGQGGPPRTTRLLVAAHGAAVIANYETANGRYCHIPANRPSMIVK